MTYPLKKKAVIVDVDGTLVDVRSTRHFVLGPKKDFDAFHEAALGCPPHPETLDWVWGKHNSGYEILVVTARKYRWESGTFIWCSTHIPVPFEGPFMRGDNDNRPDTEVKQDIFDQLSERYDIVAARDDNPKVIDLWKYLGLEVSVQPGWDGEVAAAYIEEANKERK